MKRGAEPRVSAADGTPRAARLAHQDLSIRWADEKGILAGQQRLARDPTAATGNDIPLLANCSCVAPAALLLTHRHPGRSLHRPEPAARPQAREPGERNRQPALREASPRRGCAHQRNPTRRKTAAGKRQHSCAPPSGLVS
ncbi:MAG: hypothetical protein AW07_04460 [Candidatus Accumulibacter sp. SK-11]|nr:MAG: hypothetical protein AW07_04460 [Candidatus Accumulibacter sp. SK-11]